MTSNAALRALAERAIEGLTLPAMIAVDAGYYPDRAAAKAACMEKLREKFEGGGQRSWETERGGPPCAVRFHPDAEADKDRWEVRHRPYGPHEIDENRILWVPFIHGGQRLQACYYFEWDGGE